MPVVWREPSPEIRGDVVEMVPTPAGGCWCRGRPFGINRAGHVPGFLTAWIGGGARVGVPLQHHPVHRMELMASRRAAAMSGAMCLAWYIKPTAWGRTPAQASYMQTEKVNRLRACPGGWAYPFGFPRAPAHSSAGDVSTLGRTS